MADEVITLPSFDLGVQDSEVFGNMKDADAFLSGTKSVTEEPDNIVDKNTPDPKKPTTTPAPKKEKEPVEEKPDPNKLVDSLLADGEEDEEAEEEEEPAEETDEETPESNQYETLSKDLYNLGIFTSDEENPKLPTTPEEFLQTFEAEKQKGATNWLENFLAKHGEDRRELFEAIFVNGVEPREWIEVYNEIEDYKGLDLTSESNQEKVVRAYYKRGGWSDDKIQAKLDKLKSYQDLEEEANTLHPLIIAQDEQKLTEIEENKKADLQKQAVIDTQYKEAIVKLIQENVKNKQIDGLPLDEKQGQKAFDFLYNKKWKTPSGELLTDFDKFILETKRPENIADRLKIALLKINNFDLSKVEKKAIAKESKELFSTFAQRKEKKSNKTPVASKSAWDHL